MKKIRPQDARRALRSLWKDVRFSPCADGTIRIVPVWKGGPGLFTRLHAANMVDAVLNIKGKK